MFCFWIMFRLLRTKHENHSYIRSQDNLVHNIMYVHVVCVWPQATYTYTYMYMYTIPYAHMLWRSSYMYVEITAVNCEFFHPAMFAGTLVLTWIHNQATTDYFKCLAKTESLLVLYTSLSTQSSMWLYPRFVLNV